MFRILSAIIPVTLALTVAGCSILEARRGGLGGSPKSTALVFALPGNFGEALTGPAQNSLGAAESKALDFGRAGEVISWNAIGPNVSGTVIAYQPYRVGISNCRRFRHELHQNGSTQSASGTACKRNGGDWQLVS